MRPLLLLGLLATPAAAQTHAVVLFGHAGRSTPLVDLQAADNFAPALAVGGGLALQLGPTSAVRASFSRVATEFRGAGTGFTDLTARRSYVALDVQAGWPGGGDLVPYVLVGGGGVRTEPGEGGAAKETHLGGRAGAGFNLIGGPVVFFAEAVAWAYKFTGYGFDRAQVDLFVQAGAALAIPF